MQVIESYSGAYLAKLLGVSYRRLDHLKNSSELASKTLLFDYVPGSGHKHRWKPQAIVILEIYFEVVGALKFKNINGVEQGNIDLLEQIIRAYLNGQEFLQVGRRVNIYMGHLSKEGR